MKPKQAKFLKQQVLKHFIVSVDLGLILPRRHTSPAYLSSKGYLEVDIPDFGPYPVHRLIYLIKTGKNSTYKKVIHHRNQIKTDNRFINLQLITRAYHSKMHRISRKLGISTLQYQSNTKLYNKLYKKCTY